MTRIAGASFLFSLGVSLVGCGVGGGGGGPEPGGPPQPPPPDDKIVCMGHFTLTGKFTPDTTAPRPNDAETNTPLEGCWPVGQWDFSATVNAQVQDPKEKACATAPTVLPKYSFKVSATTTEGETIMTYSILAPTTGVLSHLSVGSNGQGCVGSLELATPDGKSYWNMQPTLAKAPGTTTLEGAGDFISYSVDAWPWTDQ